MRREEKGPSGPAPDIAGPAGAVARAVAALPGVEASVHWHFARRAEVDGADFYVAGRELGHIHLDGTAHIALTPTMRDAALARGIGRPAPWAGYEGWLHLTIRDTADADAALALFRANHARLSG
jgi:hypothetical protein